MPSLFDLTGRRALVTGAGQGVGVGIARALLRQGAAVAVNDLVPERAASTASDLAAETGGTCVATPFDVTVEDEVSDGVDAAASALGGPIDVLVNNAGVPPEMTMAPFVESSPSQWRPLFDVNAVGGMLCARAVLPEMLAAGRGRIVAVTSESSRAGIALGISAYASSKGAVNSFVMTLAAETAARGVTVNAVALGLIDSAAIPDDLKATLARSHPVGRLGSPDDVGPAVAYLASDQAAWVTGQIIGINGGGRMG